MTARRARRRLGIPPGTAAKQNTMLIRLILETLVGRCAAEYRGPAAVRPGAGRPPLEAARAVAGED